MEGNSTYKTSADIELMVMVQVIVFEDPLVEKFSPITDITPMQEVIVGGVKQSERFDKIFQSRTKWLVREYLKDKVPTDRKPLEGESALLVNSRLIPNMGFLDLLERVDEGEALFLDGCLLLAKIRAFDESTVRQQIEGKLNVLRKRNLADKLHVIKNLWDIAPKAVISYLSEDLLRFHISKDESKKLPHGIESIRVIGRHPVYISENITVLGPVTIDAREGPVVIKEGTQIEPYAYLKGPLFIDKNTVIVAGSRIAGSYIGIHGRVGGEVTTSIISDYSNKYHLGFLGHSYVGRWVNIGAGTITSNLKNTYGEIKVGGQPTGLNKVGAFIGDHAKLSIGTMTYAGIRIGVASHLHGLVHEDVPPFTIYAKSIGWGLYELEVESAIRTYRRMAPRRGIDPDPVEEDLLRYLFERTETIRRNKGVIKGRLKAK